MNKRIDPLDDISSAFDYIFWGDTEVSPTPYDAVRYMSEKIYDVETRLVSDFKSRLSRLEDRVLQLEKQVKPLLELNNGSVNLEDMIRREVLKVLSNS